MSSTGQEDSQLDSRTAGSGGKRDIVKWTERMEEAYEAALEQLGGLDNAKPKAVYDLLAAEFPILSVQNVKWHIQTHRKREEMRKHKPPDYQGPTRWVGRLEEAYEAEVARQGGLHSARPKALLEALQPEFPDLTLQIIKWHLQLQRRKDQQQRRAQQGAAPPASAPPQGSSAPAQSQGRQAVAASGPVTGASASPLAQREQQRAVSAVSSGSAGGSGAPPSAMPPLSAAAAAAAARVAHARQAPHGTASPAASSGRQGSLPLSQQPSLMTSQAYPSQQGWGAASLPLPPQQLGCPQAAQQAQQQGEQPQHAQALLERILQGRGQPSLQPQQPGTPSGSLSGQATSQAGSLLHGAAAGLGLGLAADPGVQLQALRQQQLEQQQRLELAHRQQQQLLLAQLLQAQHRSAPPPWMPFLLPAAQAALEEATVTRDRCMQIVASLRQRVAELSQLLQVLAPGPAAGAAGTGPTGAASPAELEALLPLVQCLLPAAVLHGVGPGATYASRGGGRGWAAMAAAGGPATRRQRTLASLAATFPTVRDDAAAASWASGI